MGVAVGVTGTLVFVGVNMIAVLVTLGGISVNVGDKITTLVNVCGIFIVAVGGIGVNDGGMAVRVAVLVCVAEMAVLVAVGGSVPGNWLIE